MIDLVVSPTTVILRIRIRMLVLLSLRVRTNGPMFAARWFTGLFFVAGILYFLFRERRCGHRPDRGRRRQRHSSSPRPRARRCYSNAKNLPLAISGGVAIAGVETTTAEGLLAVTLFSLTASATVLIHRRAGGG